MTPEEVTAAATVAGVAVASAFGLTGFIVGLVSLHHARKAKEAATAANLIAKDSNAIARGANSLSEESNTIAREANDIARTSDSRAKEQHDVTWDCDWEKPGLYAVRNEGKDLALEVRIQITVDDELKEVTLDRVEGGQTILLEMPNSKAAWELEHRAENERAKPRPRQSGLFGDFDIPRIDMPIMNYHYIRDRVLWRTEMGTPKKHDKSHNLGSLGRSD